MAIWEILGIEETKDKDEITRAYREKLTQTNPEDKPEEFMALRKAYEEAIAQCEEKKETPVTAWIAKIKQLYDNLEERIKIENWKALFADPIPNAIDTKEEAEQELLVFLNNNNGLTKQTWQYLDSFYRWTERREEMKEKYPPRFIDYFLISVIHSEEELPIELFEPGKDGNACAQYAEWYWSVKYDDENAEESRKQMLNASEKHPFGDALLIIQSEKSNEEKIEELCKVVDCYPNEVPLIRELAKLYLNNDNPQKCRELCESYLKNNGDNFNIKCLLFSARTALKDLTVTADLRDYFSEVEVDHKDLSTLEVICEKASLMVAEILEQKEESLTNEEKWELGKCYCDGQQFEKLEKLMSQLNPQDDEYQYQRLSYCLAVNNKKDFQAGLDAMDRSIEVVRNGDPNDERNNKRLKRIYERLVAKVVCLNRLDKRNEAIQLLNEIYEQHKNNKDSLFYICQGCIETRCFDLLEKCVDPMIAAWPSSYEGYFFKAYSCYINGGDWLNEALYWVDYAMSRFSGDLQAFLLKIRILINKKSYEEAQQMIDMFEQTPLKDQPSLIYCKARLLDAQEKDEEALKLYESLYKDREQLGSAFNMLQEYLYRYLVLKETKTDYKKQKEIEKLLKLADEGLKLRPDHYGTLDYHAFIQLRLNNKEEALKEYLNLSQWTYHSPEIDERIGKIYFDDLEKNADKSLEYYRKAIDNDGDDSDHYYASVCLYYLQRFEESKEEMKIYLEKKPHDVDGLRWLAYSEMALDQLGEATKSASEVADINATNKNDRSNSYGILLNALQRQKRYDEALKLADKFKQNGNFNRYYYYRCEILKRAGRTKEARKVIRKWLKEKKRDDKADAVYALLESYILDENNAMINLTYSNYSCMLGRRYDEAFGLLSEYFYNNKNHINNAKRRLKDAKARNDKGLFPHLKNILAESYYRWGKQSEAEQYALETLEEINRWLAVYTDAVSLYRSKRIQPLAILGRYEEARAEIEYCNSHARCLFCNESGCKDALIYEAFVEETLGNLQKALELCQKGRQLYPGETDFVIYSRYYKKKIAKRK